MPRKVIGGLIQCSNPINDESVPVEKIKQAMLDKHVGLIEEAGKKGVQVLCLQEIFNGPYFCPSQDARWYDQGGQVSLVRSHARDRGASALNSGARPPACRAQ